MTVTVAEGVDLWTSSGPHAASGAAMVLVHGGPGLWDYLAPVAGLVDDLVLTHRYDQRGCGHSSGPVPSMADLLDDLEALRLHWGHERWIVLGHSFGATVGLAYAARFPDAVAGLVHCSGVGPGTSWKTDYRAAAEARLTPWQRMRRDLLGRLEHRTWAEEVEWRALCWLPDFADPDRASAWAHEDARVHLTINWEANRALNAEVDGEPESLQRNRCRAVRCPTLVIHGDGDPRPTWSAAEVAALVPDAELVVIPGAGHDPWRERPEEFRAHLRTFVSGLS